MLGIDPNPDLFGPAFVIGLANAGIFSVLAIALVLTYRISRTIGFVHYGIAVVGAYGYYHFTVEYTMPGWVALVVVLGIGAGVGAAYGLVMMNGRIAFLPPLTLSTVSIAAMLIIGAVATENFPVAPDVAISSSPFGDDSFRVWSFNVTAHRFACLLISVILVVFVSLYLNRTRAGVNVRAISDDVEAARWSGIRLYRIGVGSYAAAGAMAALAGALLAPLAGTDLSAILLVFFRALTVAVVGAFSSPALALFGAVVLSTVDSFATTSALGDINPATRESMIFAAMVLTAVAVAVFRNRNSPRTALAMRS
ncbi:branched-chain amino acid ABC transporter permease [Sporichthya sp.]|uniref:branched-chain amino acid ABC transporter permease n=1 Tax=Sporichthya sp. TaxID=65475 RepID=UPI00180C70D2|nr:branched-chain amino acid ABC transporter permease [Sporichthya sp.]MBA3741588.1 branched-chain amino acid ABC transporter permease [Sporichthya sp.]